MRNNILYLSVSFLIFFSSCGDGNKPKSTNRDTTQSIAKEYVTPPTFNPDSAYTYVEKQVSFGPRIPNTKAHKSCGDWLISKLKSYTADVLVQSADVTAYTGDKLAIRNIMARFNPKSTNRILLSAHWDTRPYADRDASDPKARFDGADDGGSGVGVLLEIARQLSLKKPAAGIDIVLFDGEDYGDSEGGPETYCLGSQHWAKNPMVPGYYAKFGILLDMVGAKGAKFNREGYSMSTAPGTVDLVWNAAQRNGFQNWFLNTQSNPVTDDHYFVHQGTGIPCIDIINYDGSNSSSGFASHWHTRNDNMSVIDKQTLNAVGQTLLDVVYNE